MLAGGRLSGGAGQRTGASAPGIQNKESAGMGAGGNSSPHRGEACWAQSEATCRETARTPSAKERYMSPDPGKKNAGAPDGAPAPLNRKSGARRDRPDLHPSVRQPAARSVVGGEGR